MRASDESVRPSKREAVLLRQVYQVYYIAPIIVRKLECSFMVEHVQMLKDVKG